MERSKFVRRLIAAAIAAAAWLIAPLAAQAQGCTDPPFVSASSSVDASRGVLVITISHNDVGWIQHWWNGASNTLFPYTPPSNPMVIEQSLWCLTGPGTFEVKAWKGGPDCPEATATASGAPLDQTPRLTPEVTHTDGSSTFMNIGYEHSINRRNATTVNRRSAFRAIHLLGHFRIERTPHLMLESRLQLLLA